MDGVLMGLTAEILTEAAGGEIAVGEYEESLQQCWHWPESKTAIAFAGSKTTVAPATDEGKEAAAKLQELYGAVASAMTEDTVAVYLPHAQKLMPPEFFRREASDPMLILMAVNVRLFRVQDGAKGEFILDTYGMEALGYPDLLCHLKEGDPNEIADLLYNYTAWMVLEGEKPKEEEALPGRDGGESWVAHYEMAVTEPPREVVALYKRA